MSSTIEAMRADAKRYRSLADRLDALASEMAHQAQPVASVAAAALPNGGLFAVPPRPQSPPMTNGEYSGLSQKDAILKALEAYGPQTTRELFERCNAGGMAFKKAQYVTALLPRLGDSVERIDGGKLRLKIPAAA